MSNQDGYTLDTFSVFVTIIGRPNVGKSSLLNRLVGQKTAIVTNKPQTTRTKVTGILTKGAVQYVFYDTPGLHKPHTKLGHRMMKAAEESLASGDVSVMLFEPKGELNEVEHEMMQSLRNSYAIAVVNKADTIQKGDVLLERVAELTDTGVFRKVVVTSADTGEGCEELLRILSEQAVREVHFFEGDLFTDQPEKVLVSELLREQVLICMQKEIPHGIAVEVERFKERKGSEVIDIDVTIYCEKKSHKGMVIGKNGQMLKRIASAARVEIEDLLGTKVNLQCWVKVRDNWRDNDTLLNRMGFKT